MQIHSILCFVAAIQPTTGNLALVQRHVSMLDANEAKALPVYVASTGMNVACALPIPTMKECKQSAAPTVGMWDGTRNWTNRLPGCSITIADNHVNWNTNEDGQGLTAGDVPLCIQTVSPTRSPEPEPEPESSPSPEPEPEPESTPSPTTSAPTPYPTSAPTPYPTSAPTSAGILHWVSSCTSCPATFFNVCDQSMWKEDSPTVGPPAYAVGNDLSTWGCGNVNPTVVRNSETGAIYILESGILHWVSSCTQCGTQLCDSNTWHTDASNIETMYTVGSSLETWGCDNIVPVVVRNSDNGAIYVAEMAN